MKKTTRLLSLLLVLVLCLSVLPIGAAAASSGWVKGNDGYWYYYEGGSPATGWKKISNTWYYFVADNSVMEYKSYPYGAMAYSDWLNGDDGYYWFQSNGAMAASQWVQDGSTWYYQLSSGRSAMGWLKIGGVWYYFAPNHYGAMVTGGPINIDGKYYYFKDSGALYTGWKQLPYYDDDDNIAGYFWAYFTSNGAVMNGWKKINGSWYYFAGGSIYSGNVYNIDGSYYYFNSSGAMQTGWQKIDGEWVYFTSSGAAQKDGWLKIGGYWYYFENYSYYRGGQAVIGSYEYHFYDSGKMASSIWVHFKDSSGNWVGWAYYLSNGHRIQSGSIKLGGKWYYFSGGWCTNP